MKKTKSSKNKPALRLMRRRIKKAALPPGSLLQKAEGSSEHIINLIDFDSSQLTEKMLTGVKEAFPFKDLPTVTWLNIDNPGPEVIEEIGRFFNIHPLVQEDILNTGQRPKCEDHETYLFITMEMIHYDHEKKIFIFEQISFILGDNYLLSFQERKGDVFDPIRERIRASKGRVRQMHSDYLVYLLIDAIIDNYFIILEKLGEQIETMEDIVLSDPREQLGHEIHRIKRELSLLRRSIWPMREVISSLQRAESRLLRESTNIFMRDVYDHTIQVMDTIETFRDMAGGMRDLYLSSLSNRMNQIMMVLTIIATIFIPLGFFAGVYGMNFDNMPELKWQWAYPAGFWSVIIVIAGSMLAYFKKKKWL